MNLRELIDEPRSLARDNGRVDTDRLWPDHEMVYYVNRVYRELARECKIIKDRNSTLCSIAVDGTTTPVLEINLDPRILSVEAAHFVTKQNVLSFSSVKTFEQNPLWYTYVGIPTKFCLDATSKKLTFNYLIDFADTLKIRVSRMPLVPLVSDVDIPEFEEEYHDHFLNGIMAWMYSKQDADTIDKVKAEEYRQKFLMDIDKIKRIEIYDRNVQNPSNNSLLAFR